MNDDNAANPSDDLLAPTPTAQESHVLEAVSATATSNELPQIKEGDLLLDLYRVEPERYEGGMGIVYKVHHRNWDVYLAMKRPNKKHFQTEKQKAGFTRECERAMELGLHPHIATCHYVRVIDGIPSIFSEWVEGGNLEDFIDHGNGKLYNSQDNNKKEILERILDISIQIVRGLRYANEMTLIHRDVKPSNILRSTDGTVKITDFGISSAREIIAYTDVAYSWLYRSPEQKVRSGKDLTCRTDIWSWAVTVLEMFLGDCSWKEGGGDGVTAGKECEYYFGRAKIPIPKSMKQLLRWCFKIDEAERPSDFGVVEDELLKIYRTEIGKEYGRPVPKAAANTADSLNNRALSYLDLGKQEDAERYWDEALKKEPNHPVSMYNQTVHLWQEKRIEDFEAVHQLFTLHKIMGNSWQTGILLAKIHMLRFDVENAIDCLESAEKVADDDGKKEIYLLLEKCKKMPEMPKSVFSHEKTDFYVNGQICMSKDEQYIMFCPISNSEVVEMWNIHQKIRIQTFNINSISYLEAISISEDNKLVLFHTASRLIVYEIQTRNELICLDKKEMKLLDGCFAKDKLRVCKRCSDNTYEIIDFSENSFIHVSTITANSDITTSFGYNGNYIVFKSEKSFALYDAQNGQCLKTCNSDYIEAVQTVSVSSDGKYALFNHIFEVSPHLLFDIFNDRQIVLNTYFSGSINHHCSLFFTPDGKKMISQKKNKGFVLFTIPSLKWKSDYILQQVKAVDTLLLFESQIREFTEKIKQSIAKKNISEALFFLNSARQITGFTQSEKYEHLCLQISKYCRIQSIRSCQRILNFYAAGKSISVTHDGLYLLTFGGSKELNLRNAKTGEIIQTYTGHSDLVTCAAFTPDNMYVVSAANDDTVKIWNTSSGDCIWSASISIRQLCISPDGRYAYMTEKKSMYNQHCLVILDIKNKKLGRGLPVFEDTSCCSLATSPDGYKCFMGGSIQRKAQKSQAVIIMREFDPNLNCQPGEHCSATIFIPPCTNLLAQVSSLAVSKDGKLVVFGVYCSVFIWDLSTYKYLELYQDNQGVEAVAISPDNSFIFAGHIDGCIRIVDFRNREILHTFQEYHVIWNQTIEDIYYDSNRHVLYSSYTNGMVCAHQLDFEYEFPGWSDWNEGARPYLEIFLTLHPNWTDEEFNNILIPDLQNRGYGWLRPEGVRAVLENMILTEQQ